MAKLLTGKDFLGQEVVVGDLVVFSEPNSGYFCWGKVVKITPKGATVEYDPYKSGYATKKSRASSQMVKITGEDTHALMALNVIEGKPRSARYTNT